MHRKAAKSLTCLLLALCVKAHACQPTQANGTGTDYRVAERDGVTAVAWLCGTTWEWTGAPAVGLGLDKSNGKELADKLIILMTRKDHGNDEYRALFWPLAKVLIEGKDRKVEDGLKV